MHRPVFIIEPYNPWGKSKPKTPAEEIYEQNAQVEFVAKLVAEQARQQQGLVVPPTAPAGGTLPQIYFNPWLNRVYNRIWEPYTELASWIESNGNTVVGNFDDLYKSRDFNPSQINITSSNVQTISYLNTFPACYYYVYNNAGLTTITESTSQSYSASFYIHSNTNLVTVSLDSTTNAGDVFLSNNNNLVSASFKNLTNMDGNLYLNGSSLQVVDAPNLTNVWGRLTLNTAPNLITSSFMSKITYLPYLSFASNNWITASFSCNRIDYIDFYDTVTKLFEANNMVSGSTIRMTRFPNGMTASFNSLQYLDNYLCISGATNLEVFNTPPVTGSFQIQLINCPKLVSIQNLTYTSGSIFAGSITSLSRGLTIHLCSKLTTPLIFDNITSIEGGIYLSRNPLVTTASFQNLTEITGGISIFTTNTALSTINFPNLTYMSRYVSVQNPSSGISIINNAALRQIYFPGLQWVDGGITGTNNTVLTSISFPSLQWISGVVFCGSNTALTSISFPSLSYCAGLQFLTSSNLSTISLPNLTQVTGSFTIGATAPWTSLTMPSLSLVTGTASICFNNSASNVDLSGLVSVPGGLRVCNNSRLTSITMSNYLPTNNGLTHSFVSNSFNTASVNHILSRFVANPDFNSGMIYLRGGTNAAPDGQGIADVTTLTTRGVTVLTN